MLSAGAFNALLKTLEEPPSYVIFILATTEANKIPVTILSRCQRYDFKRLTVEQIEERMKEALAAAGEELPIEEKALKYLAKSADGAMRDAWSLLSVPRVPFRTRADLRYGAGRAGRGGYVSVQ